MPQRRAIAAATVVVVAILVAGCSLGDDADDSGVTAIDGTEGEGVTARCVVADPEGELLVQPGGFTVGQRTRLTSVTLDAAENLDVVEAAVADYRGPEDLQGVVLQYPPRRTSFVQALTDWEQRRPVLGLRLGPRDGRQAVLVAVRLTDPDADGHLRGVTIRARTADGPRTYSWEQLVLVLPADETCTAEAVAATTEWTGGEVSGVGMPARPR